MSGYRSSDPALAYGDLPPGPQRWDRERFDRYSRGGNSDERDYYSFKERDSFTPRRESRFAEADVIERRSPRRFEERERFVEEDRYGPPVRRRTEFMDEPTPSEIANRALAPYRRKSIVDREFDRETIRRPRPSMVRRQSSLDTFDRRPMPRYGDEYSIPADVPIPLPIRRPEPPRERIREREFEEIRYRDLEPDAFDEYEDIRIRRERSRGPRRASVAASRASKSVRSGSSSSSSSFEEVEAVEEKKEEKVVRIGKRGKTRMPKRLAHKQVVIDMGVPFEEEEDFIIIQRALAKEHIDEIIERSKVIKAAGEKEKTIYKYEEKIEGGHLHHPLPAPVAVEEGETLVMKRTEIVEGAAPPPHLHIGSRSRPSSPARSVGSLATHHTHHSRARSVSTHHHHHPREVVEERIEESGSIGGPLTVLAVPERKSDREIRREIASLEAERRALRFERETDEKRALALAVRDRDGYEVVERREVFEERPFRETEREREIVRVEKDRKGRSRSRAPDPKLVALAMATLS